HQRCSHLRLCIPVGEFGAGKKVVSSQEARPQKSCCNISLAGLPELLGSPQLYHIFCVLLSSRNVASFSDGEPGKGTGVPYFYLTILDPTPTNAMKDPRSSFTISEYPLGTCGKVDPENPTCAKITLTGKDHDFQIYKLVIEDIFLIDRFGGPEPLTVEEYLEAKM
ncbi:Protein CREG1, partial [Linum grandiflorum]